MFYRIAFCLLVNCFAHFAWAGQDVVKKDPAETVFDLERSVAILQVSSASVDDVQVLQKQINVLKQNQASSDRVDFLSNVVFLLVVVVLLLVWRFWLLSRRFTQQSISIAALKTSERTKSLESGKTMDNSKTIE